MNTQINVRMPSNLLNKAKSKAKKQGYNSVQDFIREIVRENLFEDISKKELQLVRRLTKAVEENNAFGSEDELFQKLKK